nr:16S rRNA (guanine(966)-N(2))-methyltransferase RsmD [Anaerolineae bacterium]
MGMRVIGGSARGRKLRLVPGTSTRPVRSVVRESLFNILGVWVRGTRWLDMFAGTGSIGIEALSRGAGSCLFLDTSRNAVRTIKLNLEATGLSRDSEIRQADAFRYLEGEYDREFDVIYIAPPQYRELWKRGLLLIDARPDWLSPDGIAIVQIDPNEYEEPDLKNLAQYDSRRYGSTLLCFYERKAAENL